MPEGHEQLDEHLSADEKLLAKLGYKQELHRSWSGFSNFAISFSIISILAGCFTTFGQGFNNGGPIAISWGWPIVAGFILIIGFTMSELVSAYPTSGGIYWWASKLGGPAAGFYTGWLNLIGLIAVTASVAYGCRDLLRPHVRARDQRGLGGGYSSSASLLDLRGHPRSGLAAEHLQRPPDGDHQQHLGVVARGRRGADRPDPDLRPGPAPEHQLRVHRAGQQLRLRRAATRTGRPTGCSWLPSGSCSRSTRSPGSTPRPTCRRRPTLLPTARPRASGSRSSTPPSAAGSCCSPSCSPSRTDDAVTAGVNQGRYGLIFNQALGTNLATMVLAHLGRRAVLLHGGVHDQCVADDVRLLP